MDKLIILYILIVSILITLYLLVRIHYKKLLAHLYYLVDKIFFEISLFVYNEKKNIPKFDNFLEILYQPKKKFIKGFHHEIEDFYIFWQEYKKNIEDLSKIINREIIDIDKIIKTTDTINSISNLKKLLKFLKFLICITTLGLFCLLTKFTND